MTELTWNPTTGCTKISAGCKFCCAAADVAFVFKQWGGRNKKANGRLLNGRTYDAMPDPLLQERV